MKTKIETYLEAKKEYELLSEELRLKAKDGRELLSIGYQGTVHTGEYGISPPDIPMAIKWLQDNFIEDNKNE